MNFVLPLSSWPTKFIQETMDPYWLARRSSDLCASSEGMTFEGVTVVTTQVYVVTFKCTVDKYTVTPNKVTVAADETVKDLKLSGGTCWTNYSVSADVGTATATATDDLAVTFKWEAPSNLAADTQVTISYQA